MSALTLLYRSSIGKKAAMAVTGLVIVGWLCAHMAGNMLIYMGPETFNAYGAFIQANELKWVMRAVMLACLVTHVYSAITLTRANRAARPVAYAGGRADQVTTAAAKTMAFGGVALLAFIVFHLLHLTTGTVHPEFVHGDVYRNVVTGFSNPVVAVVYIVANLALAMHLYHGIWSGMQTLGLNHPAYLSLRDGISLAVPVIVVGGNISVPLAVLSGIIAL